MNAADPGARGGSGRHHPLAHGEPAPYWPEKWVYRAGCSCGWTRKELNSKRENAIRAARRHVQEAQG